MPMRFTTFPAIVAAAITVVAVLLLVRPAGAQVPDLEPRVVLPNLVADRYHHPVQVALNKASQQWEAAGIENYTIVMTVSVFGPNKRHTVTVEDGEVVEWESLCTLGGDPYPCPAGGDPSRFTVPGLFDRVRENLERVKVTAPGTPDVAVPGDWYVNAEFTEPYGVPAWIEWGLWMVLDSGERFEVQSFTINQ